MHDPIGSFESIRDLYLTYLETAFRIRDRGVSAERRELLEKSGTFCTEPFIEPLARYESSPLTLDELALRENQTILREFSKSERIAFVDLALAGLFDSTANTPGGPLLRRATHKLYAHQA